MSFRVTNSMLVRNFMSDLNGNITRMGTLQEQLATNKRINKLSDDPVGVITALQSRNKISRLGQFKDNINSGISWLTEAETSLREVDKILQSVYEQNVYASSDDKTQYDRGSVAVYVKQMMEHVVQTANSAIGEQYTFAGYNTTNKPFRINADGVLEYNGIRMYGTDAVPLTAAEQTALDDAKKDHKSFTTGFTLDTVVSYNGVEMMETGDKNIYKVLNDLYDALMMDDSATAPHNDPDDPAYNPNLVHDTIATQITRLQKAQESNLANVVDIGSRINRLDMMDTRYDEDIISYTSRKSYVEDCDQAQVIMKFKMAEAIYQAALASGARVIQPTLMDFL